MSEIPRLPEQHDGGVLSRTSQRSIAERGVHLIWMLHFLVTLALVCTALGIVLVTIGLASLYAFVGPNYKNAPADLTPAQIEAGTTAPGPTSVEPPASQ